MASSAFPSVVRAVMTTAESALSDVRVVRGRDTSGDPSDVVMVGVQDIRDVTDGGWTSAGNFQQTRQTFHGGREEAGAVNCLVLAHNGDDDQDAACSTALGYIADLEAAVRADETLGLSQFEYVVADMDSGDISESQNAEGAYAVLAFVITYRIRI